MIRSLAAEIVDEALSHDEFDAVEVLAKRLPMMMLGRILGVPDADLPWLVEKGDALIGNSDPDFTNTVIDKMDTQAYRFMPFRSPAGVELYDYADAVLRGDKPVDPEGVLARVIAANAADGVMEARDFKNFFCLLVAAGNDTTRYSISMALYELTRDPSLLEQLRSGTVWDTAADEFIRLASPTMHFRRTATEDTELGGQAIRAGDKVILWFVSGNRDATVLTSPTMSIWPAIPIRTSRSGRVGCTCVWACGWHGWRSGCCSRSSRHVWRGLRRWGSRPGPGRTSFAGSRACL